MLFSALEDKGGLGCSGDYYNFCEKIYDEYFDHRLYLMEQYLDSVGRIIEDMGVVKVFAFMVKYLEKFTFLMNLEHEYYMRSFSNQERFDQFRKENEYDLIFKKIRPFIISCPDFGILCNAIDVL